MDVSDALRLKVLEDESRKLKAKRTACWLVNLFRSTNRYRESRKDDQDLRESIKELAEAAALLILKKKVHQLWGDTEDD